MNAMTLCHSAKHSYEKQAYEKQAYEKQVQTYEKKIQQIIPRTYLSNICIYVSGNSVDIETLQNMSIIISSHIQIIILSHIQIII